MTSVFIVDFNKYMLDGLFRTIVMNFVVSILHYYQNKFISPFEVEPMKKVVTWKCSVIRVFLKFWKIHRKIPVTSFLDSGTDVLS